MLFRFEYSYLGCIFHSGLVWIRTRSFPSSKDGRPTVRPQAQSRSLWSATNTPLVSCPHITPHHLQTDRLSHSLLALLTALDCLSSMIWLSLRLLLLLYSDNFNLDEFRGSSPKPALTHPTPNSGFNSVGNPPSKPIPYLWRLQRTGLNRTDFPISHSSSTIILKHRSVKVLLFLQYFY
jgi:hypothetical protein